jgi:hypothetical protein
MKKDICKIEGVAPRLSRRAVELFADNRFKPRVIRSKRVYSRKRVGKHDSC